MLPEYARFPNEVVMYQNSFMVYPKSDIPELVAIRSKVWKRNKNGLYGVTYEQGKIGWNQLMTFQSEGMVKQYEIDYYSSIINFYLIFSIGLFQIYKSFKISLPSLYFLPSWDGKNLYKF